MIDKINNNILKYVEKILLKKNITFIQKKYIQDYFKTYKKKITENTKLELMYKLQDKNRNLLIFFIKKLKFNINALLLFDFRTKYINLYDVLLFFLKTFKKDISNICLNEALLIAIENKFDSNINNLLVDNGANQNLLNIKTTFLPTRIFRQENRNFFRKNSFWYNRDRTIIKLILKELGHPENKIPPVFHIVGSNGKGSTANFIQTILENDGYKIHKFTSPSMIEDGENYIVAGKRVDEKLFYNALSLIMLTYNKIKDTEEYQKAIMEADSKDINPDVENRAQMLNWCFDICAIILIYSKIKADFTIIEAITGGINDLTNVFYNNTIATIITPIITGDNHIKNIGRTVKERAYQKSRICKPNIPIISSNQEDSAIDEIKNSAKEFNCPLYIENINWHTKINDNNFQYIGFNKNITIPFPDTLLAQFQIQNASVALSSILASKIQIKDSSIINGIKNFKKYGESIKITDGNFVNETLKEKYEIILARCKNHKGLELNLDYLKKIKENKEIWFIFNMADHQTQEGTIKILNLLKNYNKNLINHLLVVNFRSKKSMSKEKTIELFNQNKIKYKFFDEISLAIDYFYKKIKNSKKKHILFFAPLLYVFFGELYKLNCSEELFKNQNNY